MYINFKICKTRVGPKDSIRIYGKGEQNCEPCLKRWRANISTTVGLKQINLGPVNYLRGLGVYDRYITRQLNNSAWQYFVDTWKRLETEPCKPFSTGGLNQDRTSSLICSSPPLDYSCVQLLCPCHSSIALLMQSPAPYSPETPQICYPINSIYRAVNNSLLLLFYGQSKRETKNISRISANSASQQFPRAKAPGKETKAKGSHLGIPLPFHSGSRPPNLRVSLCSRVQINGFAI